MSLFGLLFAAVGGGAYVAGGIKNTIEEMILVEYTDDKGKYNDKKYNEDGTGLPFTDEQKIQKYFEKEFFEIDDFKNSFGLLTSFYPEDVLKGINYLYALIEMEFFPITITYDTTGTTSASNEDNSIVIKKGIFKVDANKTKELANIMVP